MTFKEQYGHWLPDDWARGGVFGDEPTAQEKEIYYQFLVNMRERKQKPSAWVNRYMFLDFGLEGMNQKIAP